MSGEKSKQTDLNGDQAPSSNSAVKWVLLIYFCSGMCSLIDEVVWVRLLKLKLGNTVYASSIVVSVFMGGLALGALIMGRYADRVKNRLRLYALLEICATISALSFPFALRTVDNFYKWVFLALNPSPAILCLFQALISAAILMIPAMMMGSTLPLLGRYITDMRNRAGWLVGGLYSLNMLGAALGCFSAGFVLIRMVGVMGTLYIAAAVNLLVAYGGWRLSRYYKIADISEAKAVVSKRHDIAEEELEGKKKYILFSAFFASGLISIGYELIWMRSTVYLLGGYTYVFSAVLTIYLIGNVVGTGIGSYLSKRLKNPAVGLGVILTCLGVSGIFYLPWVGLWLSNPAGQVFPLFNGFMRDIGFHNWIANLSLCHSFILFILPSILMGIGFPLAIQSFSKYRYGVGKTTGTVYGINTIGAVLGGVVTGFFLIPWLGVQLSITLLGSAGIMFGALMVLTFSYKATFNKRLAVLGLGLALGFTIILTIVPMNLFEKNIVPIPMPAGEILEVKEGINGTFSVHRNTKGDLELRSENLGIAGDGDFRIAQKMLGHMGTLLNKNARDILSIGFGAGETTACLAINNLNRLDCVEIAPEVVQLALKFFEHINLGDELDRKVNMIYMDGKNYLYLTEQKYDIIINGANIPTHSGSAPLFTKEHFQNALEHLNPGGLFITKLHLMSTSKPSFDSIIGTFMEVFPHATIWFPTTKVYKFFYLVGSRDKQWFSPQFIEAQLEKKEIKKSISYLNIYNYSDVLSCYVGDKNDIKHYLREYAVNADHTPYVEFTPIAKNGLSASEFFKFIDVVHTGSVLDHIDWSGMPQDEQNRWQKKYSLLHEIWHFQLKILYEDDVLLSLQRLHDYRQLLPKNKALLDLEDYYLSFAKSISFSDANRTIMGIDEMLRQRPEFGAGWLIKSWALQAKKDMGGSLIAGKKAVLYSPFTVSAYENLGFIYLTMGQFHEAISMYRRAIDIKPEKAELYQDLGKILLMCGQLDNAVSQFSQALKIRPTFVEAHIGLARALSSQGKNEEAITHLREVLKTNPGNLEASNNLAWIFATHPDPQFRNSAEAIRLAEMVCATTEYKLPLPLHTLAAAYAESGLFDKAQLTARKAAKLAESAGQKKLLVDIEKGIQLYKLKRSFCNITNPKAEIESMNLSESKTGERNELIGHSSGKEGEFKMRISIISVKDRPVAQEILRKLKAGGDFKELVRQYSIGPGTEDGGDIGYVAPGDMMEDLRAVAMNLKIGQYSETLETSNGYFIIMKTDEKSSTETLSIETQRIPGTK